MRPVLAERPLNATVDAEFVTAVSAFHVRATFDFLDHYATFAAFLSVRLSVRY